MASRRLEYPLSREETKFCSRLAHDTASVLAKNLRQMSAQNGSTTRQHASAFFDTFLRSVRQKFHHEMGFPDTNGDETTGVAAAAKTTKSKRFSIRRKRSVEETNDSEIIKEGHLRQMIDNGGSSPEWTACRVVLAKRPGGHMLEFYQHKGTKPKSGIFCFLIGEVRRTKSVELDLANTFVVKAQSIEYILEASSRDEVQSWLSAISRSVDCGSSDGGSPIMSRRRPESTSSSLSPRGDTFSLSETPPPPPPPFPLGDAAPPPPPDDPSASCDGMPHVTRLASVSSSTVSFNEADKRQSGGSWVFSPRTDHPFSRYPWFHGSLPRMDAASLVLEDGQHGTWLLRQSGTRGGDCVLTFNHLSRAKHLRMTVSGDGICKVQHLQFSSVVEMLENFKRNPIPLEGGSSTDVDVVLGDYIQAVPLSPPPAPLPSSAGPTEICRRNSEKETPFFGGGGSGQPSLPRRSHSQASEHRAYRDGRLPASNSGHNPGCLRPRAPENPYSIM